MHVDFDVSVVRSCGRRAQPVGEIVLEQEQAVLLVVDL